MSENFSLWLEFEEYVDGYPGSTDDPLCDYCNALLSVGRTKYGLNIWTFGYLERAKYFDELEQPRARRADFILPPDLLVARLDRACIESSIAVILRNGIPQSWAASIAEE